jgi:hypothetical protein
VIGDSPATDRDALVGGMKPACRSATDDAFATDRSIVVGLLVQTSQRLYGIDTRTSPPHIPNRNNGADAG